MVVSGGQIIRSQSKIRGRDRKGIRARDLLVQATDPMAKVMEASPEFDEPKTMVETMRISGADCLTAQDTAIYKFMLARARDVDIEAEWHVISVDVMSKFLNVDGDRGVRLSRIRESVKRIDHTRVSYDFRSTMTRIDGDIPLLLAQFEQDLRTGTAQVRYSIPRPVRAAILEATAYAMLQLNVFPLFSSKYSGRLYPRLAYFSGLPGTAGKRWEIEPLKLARSLSYPVNDILHFASFMRRCVEPALADFAKEEVKDIMAFTVDMAEPIPGTGRGRPVEKLVFLISPTVKRQETTQAARLSTAELNVIGLADERLAPHELPSTLVVGRAVTATGLDAITLSDGWRSAYERAKADPRGEVMPGLEAWLLISVVRKDGVGAGFAMWSQAAVRLGSVPTHRIHATPVVIAPAAPAATAVPEGGLSAGLLAIVRERPTEEARLARAKEIALGGAQDILDSLRGFYPGGKFKAYYDDGHFAVYCDGQVSPWNQLEKHVKGFGSLVASLRILRRTDDEQRRKSLWNFAYAVKEWDLPKVLRIAGAIIAADKAGTMPAAPPARGRPRTARGFAPTRQVTEMSAEYDLDDPAYAARAMPWDDRDAADLDPDQCPF